MKHFWLFLLACSSAVSAEVQPFISGSLQTIVKEYAGRPFILSLWSANCTHCPAELKTLGQLKKRYPKLNLVLVSTDSPEQSDALAEMAEGFGLGKIPQWVFADPQGERLRFEIDKQWYGELPRTYFFDRQHRATGISGVVEVSQLERWAKENSRK
jgi:thiol-disulfide isomerase/thioredoxin